MQVPTHPKEPMCGWLLKAKQSRSFLRNYNRHFFTINFDLHLMYYSDCESSKRVSVPVPFSDIVGVEPLSGTLPLERSNSKSSIASVSSALRSSLRRPSQEQHASITSVTSALRSSLRRSSLEQHGFVLRTVGKTMQLLCTSQEEVEQWMSAFEEAMSLGHWKAQAETSAETRVTSSCRRSSSLSSDGSDLEVRGSSRLGSGAVCAGSAVPFDRDVLEDAVSAVVSETMCALDPVRADPVIDIVRPTALSRYSDRGEGLTMQERLLQMEFSDDDD